MTAIIKAIKLRVSFIAVIRYAKIAIIIFMASGFVWMSWFLYDNLYKPLTQAMAVAELRAKVALITVNRKDFETILAFIDKQKQLPAIDWAMIPDPTSKIHVPLPAPKSTEPANPPSEPIPPAKVLR